MPKVTEAVSGKVNFISLVCQRTKMRVLELPDATRVGVYVCVFVCICVDCMFVCLHISLCVFAYMYIVHG